ncbi:MAG: hypothetical protein HC876_20265, partial [Chloroflexaceae bacterium]|nr:hypothetical protein [Chloroflexaceae bacterium]
MSKALKRAVNLGLIGRNPAKQVVLPSAADHEYEPRVLQDAEITAIMQQVEGHRLK